MSVPAGFALEDGKKLPIGLQFIARPLDEATMLSAAHAFEQAAQIR
jgi:Asp-tRNA(Asn)/Glu-tRNA(Gln) amidotransferase A subunit family amidase